MDYLRDYCNSILVLDTETSGLSFTKDEIIEFSEISKFINTPVKRYSSGMFVKLAFAVDIFLFQPVMGTVRVGCCEKFGALFAETG